MLDPKRLRSELDEIATQLTRRGFTLDVDTIRSVEERRKLLQIETQNLQNARNSRSKTIGQAKAKGEDIQPLLAEVANMGDTLKEKEQELARLQTELDAIVMGIPNLLDASVPDGRDENANVEIRRWGEPAAFAFEPKDHVDLGLPNGWMDFDAGAKLTGSRFVVMRGAMARMHRALIQLMLDTHTLEHGYTEAYVPYMVNADSLRGTGQLP